MIKLNGEELKIIQFPNGERGICVDDKLKNNYDSEIIGIEFTYKSDLDLFDLFMVKSHLDDKVISDVKIILYLSYVPYSRMDRTEGKYVFTLKYLCKYINNLNFDRVFIKDIHSDVSLALLNNAVEKSFITNDVVISIMEDYNLFTNESNLFGKNGFPTYIVLPDAGASKRYKSLFNKFEGKAKVIVMDKVRDFATGEIKSITVSNPEVIEDEKFNIIIMDDICSRGGTFVGSYEALKEYGCVEAGLIITHCETTISEGEIPNKFKFVITTNSMLTEEDIKCIEDKFNEFSNTFIVFV